MKKILIIFLLPFIFSCEKDCVSDLPSCVENWIDSVKNDEALNAPVEVNEYRYQGKKVYLLTADCCDQYNKLYDADCNYICSPTGGIAGQGDGKCTDFLQKAEHIRLVWKKE